jgi:protein-tyrosine phosphatase
VPDPPAWIELDGVANARDVAGVATADGRVVKPGRLLRSGHLQELTAADVALLVGRLGVRWVVDLRTVVEVEHAGPSPIHEQTSVSVVHLSLHPDESGRPRAIATAVRPDSVTPWRSDPVDDEDGAVVGSYLRYLERRPDSILAALRAIAEPEGATLVHCAAGKDRTGVVVAMALAAVGVAEADIGRDYAATQERMHAVLASLARSELYARDVADADQIPHATADLMATVLVAVRRRFGGVGAWLSEHGWTAMDQARLEHKLLD